MIKTRTKGAQQKPKILTKMLTNANECLKENDGNTWQTS